MFEESTGWTAAVLGAMVGLLLGQLRTLRVRVGNLERKLDRVGETTAAAMPLPEQPAPAPAPAATPATLAEAPASTPAPAPAGAPSAAVGFEPAPGVAQIPAAASPDPRPVVTEPLISPSVVAAQPTAVDNAVAAVKR
jgi:hypothetical protein